MKTYLHEKKGSKMVHIEPKYKSEVTKYNPFKLYEKDKEMRAKAKMSLRQSERHLCQSSLKSMLYVQWRNEPLEVKRKYINESKRLKAENNYESRGAHPAPTPGSLEEVLVKLMNDISIKEDISRQNLPSRNSLYEISIKKPDNALALAMIKGIGAKRLEICGDLILKAIAEYNEESSDEEEDSYEEEEEDSYEEEEEDSSDEEEDSSEDNSYVPLLTKYRLNTNIVKNILIELGATCTEDLKDIDAEVLNDTKLKKLEKKRMLSLVEELNTPEI